MFDLNTQFDDSFLNEEKLAFLKTFQANILKGHGRERVALLFLTVENIEAARNLLHGFPVSDAASQLLETQKFKATQEPGDLVRLVFLTAKGLRLFGHDDVFDGNHSAYSAGMRNDEQVLDAGVTDTWQNEFRSTDYDLLLLIAFHEEPALLQEVNSFIETHCGAEKAFNSVFVQHGKSYRNIDNEGVEHFGYVDGRSQPLFLREDIRREEENGGINMFNPVAPLSQVLLPDPLADGGFGSFFVFRKLEQNVEGFKAREADLVGALQLTPPDEERAGAMAVGRFEDGTPLVLSQHGTGVPVVNNFSYSSDPNGLKCPFQAHIRKTHPRGSALGSAEFDHGVQMARRGITYGERRQDPNTKEFLDQPSKDVGLLFMSYQASIENQFRFMQTVWANNPNFPVAGTGIDPIIGQFPAGSQVWHPSYGVAGNQINFPFDGFVRLMGGDYFYAPSPAGLKAL
ncbi:Dyp-type peroxidase [Asticcacaulis excentricus]|uniref:Peroxidase n=1 Tax=Asticcacaulis excentricus TaxID=78587 RepID=A0A3G9GAP6_9CAUL|nr:peroxidase [Asticcacaulis excentricus]BBF81528.1 peroxidase [Asticcacaulis excentricus]